MEGKNERFESTFEYKLIYIFGINDGNHEGVLKIGDATLKTNEKYDSFQPNCHELNAAARKRIDEYTATAGIQYQLLHTEIAVMNSNGVIKAFRDHKVHSVLKRSGIKNVYFDTTHKQNEWFECKLTTAIDAIKAVKEGKTALAGYQIANGKSPIILRPEQEEAIKQTIKQFQFNHHMLWNAKMRFGKTLSTLELVKRMKFNKTIIITHRPDVDKGWFEDFNKIFYEDNTAYSYGSKQIGKTLKELLASNKPFVYFASIQDLRGSEKAGGKFDKNDDVFKTKWDLVVTDEAHEGTQTELGKNVRDLLISDDNYDLSLSGTPFNLFDQYASENTFTWDYIMEQKAKYDWIRDPNKLGDSNPYEELPKLNIFTYQLERLIKTDFDLEDKAFNFKEFFRVWTSDKEKDHAENLDEVHIGKFVHEDAVKAFLDLLVTKSDTTNYPFSTEEYRDFFRHTLWMIPGVKEAKALTELLKAHPVFGQFSIVNVAGDGDYDYKEEQKARDKLSKAMTNHPENTRTITLSCGRLTTGVTVSEWTGVLMLYGTYMTDAKSYLQTIFRVQSPGNINGKIKENCYVFDFAPDRTLRVVYDSVQKMSKMRKPQIDVACLMGEFLNFCPVIALTDVSYMKTLSTNELLQEVKRVYAERVVESGFDDRCLYDDLKLKQLDKDALDKFEKLREIVGKTNQTKKTDVKVNENDLTAEQKKELEGLETKQKEKKELSEEEKKRLEELKKLQDKKRTAISILRGISIRIPLLVYGMDIDYSTDITIDEFADKIDDASWKEFMPTGVTKDIFKQFIEYYDKDIFIKACRNIRTIAKQCDDLKPTERIQKLADLFAKFKNPDKETVLTPWRVVNMHMSQTIGGYCFFDENFEKEIEKPEFKDIKDITNNIFKDDGKVLEINSKTGLYPLYVAYTFYREKVKDKEDSLSFDECKKLWNDVIENNIFVICKTEMAKQITRRTLLGYTKGKINAHAFDDLINQMKEKQQQLVDKILRPSFWNKGGKDMKFNAVVGNPPYQLQVNEGGKGLGAIPIYNIFIEQAKAIKPNFVSMIIPSRWFSGGVGLDNFRKNMLNDSHIEFIYDFTDSKDCFPGVDINGGICFFLWNSMYSGKCMFTNSINSIKNTQVRQLNEFDIFIRRNDALSILKKVLSFDEPKLSKEGGCSPQTPYGFLSTFSGTKNKTKLDDCEILTSKGWGYVERNLVTKSEDTIDLYKPMISKLTCEHAGTPDKNGKYRVLSRMEILKPNQICSQSYLTICPQNTERQALNVSNYLKTKFVRFLIQLTLTGMNMSIDSFKFVPWLDFNEDWDDEKLYKKYNLDDNEINVIESLIRDMN